MKTSASAGHFIEGFRYLVMSGMSAVLSLGVPFLLHEGFAVRPDIAVACGLAAAFVMNFFTARLFVFRKKGPVKQATRAISRLSVSPSAPGSIWHSCFCTACSAFNT